MWGNMALETITQVNFGIGFSNMKSDVLIHLAQWQYWWWFWFSFLWSFYYLLILRVLRFRTLKFRPRLATTMRPHGKWGDLIVCLIPVSWCANILSNANLILRMIEWQAESGLFTVRIRGKQWYWIYKFELKTVTDILSVPKNLGRNKWVVYTPGDIQVADDYLHILQLRAQGKWVHNYWSKELLKNPRNDGLHIITPFEVLSYNIFSKSQERELNNFKNLKSVFLSQIGDESIDSEKQKHNDGFSQFFLRVNNKKICWKTSFKGPLNIFFDRSEILVGSDLFFDRKDQKHVLNNIFSELNKKPEDFIKSSKMFSDQIETTRWFKRSMGSLSPCRLLKVPFHKKEADFTDSVDRQIIRVRFSENTEEIAHKPLPHSVFLVMKQKRYKRRKLILPRYKLYRDDKGKYNKQVRYSANPLLADNGVVIESDLDNSKHYNFVKKKKTRSENTSVVLSRRILRTKRTLVLPAHVNLTAVTNSYDVIHSWFIPGLGLKMDCIPGRATHHTFHIDNVGFYYGQCAEVCGRFHHHMPIRICALPFEHFLVWWHSFGLPKLMFNKPQRNYQAYYGFRKFVW
jgi:heme/copper-type cytochrome/quinol oxidase subunit 2